MSAHLRQAGHRPGPSRPRPSRDQRREPRWQAQARATLDARVLAGWRKVTCWFISRWRLAGRARGGRARDLRAGHR
eukprot:7169199-Pyramimonas_sp.AAC.1